MDKAALKHEVSSCLVLLEEELRSFVANARERLWRKAITNLYYAAYDATCALLWSRGLRAESHDGAQSMLALHFVKPGVLPRDATKKLNALMSDRHAADYKGEVVFGPQDVEGHRAWVMNFLLQSLKLLSAGPVRMEEKKAIEEAIAAARKVEIADEEE